MRMLSGAPIGPPGFARLAPARRPVVFAREPVGICVDLREQLAHRLVRWVFAVDAGDFATDPCHIGLAIVRWDLLAASWQGMANKTVAVTSGPRGYTKVTKPLGLPS